MSQTRYIFSTLLIALISIALLAGLAWAKIRFAENVGGGIDFAAVWNGTRGILMEGVSPYDSQTTSKIQQMVYGRQARADEPALRVAMPLYGLVPLLPVGAIPDPLIARGVWALVLEGALAAITIFGFRVVRWRVPLVLGGILVIFGLFWVPGFLPLLDGDPVILVGLLMVATLAALDARIDELAGGFIFLSTIKIGTALPFLIFILIWVIAQRRYRVLAGIAMTGVVLIAIATLIFPDWVWPFLRAVTANARSAVSLSLPRALELEWPGIGLSLGRWLVAIFIVGLVLEWRAARKRDFRIMLWTACLTIAATPLLGFSSVPANYAVLLFPLIYTFSIMDERWPQYGRWMIVSLMVVLFLGLWALFLRAGPIGPTLYLVLPFALVLGIYWVRWWALRPPRTWLEEIREHE